MNILNIDTSTEACSVALLNDDHITHEYQWAPRLHAKYILAMCERLMAQSQLSLNQLDSLAFSAGPGAFTGLRIAAGVTQGIAFAHDLPVISLSSLQIIAQGLHRQFSAKHVIAAIDARMQEIYIGQYQATDANLMMPTVDDSLVSPNALPSTAFSHFMGAGSGWDQYHEALQQHYTAIEPIWHEKIYPNAQDMAPLAAHFFNQGNYTSAEYALPTYIRNNVAKKKPVHQ